MLLPQPEELVKVLHFITDAELVVAVLYVREDKVHELAEDALRRHCLFHAISDKRHHHIESVLVFDLHLEILILDLQQDYLVAILLILDPASCHDRYEDDKVYDVHVVSVSQGLANDTDEED